MCYSDIGDKYVGLKKRNSDIGSVQISTSEFIPISDIEEKNTYFPADLNLRSLD
jgi:hypothetical protein